MLKSADRPFSQRIGVAIVILIAAIAFVLGIRWGLPSRAVDAYLFGSVASWPGEKIAKLAPQESDARGADVDANPIDRSHAVILNRTDAQRAEIIRRYRLFSYQPDEMITLKSLSRIAANHGDPRLYQYGGLWIYPIGAMLKAGSAVGLIDLRSDQSFYLDHPQAFGRFYIVARLYCALWGTVAALAMFFIIRRIGGDMILSTLGGVCFVMMPLVMNAAHEAKPHLPGAAIILLAALAGNRYLITRSRRWAIITGICCGAAGGMVASGFVAFAILIALLMFKPEPIRRRLGSIALAAIAGIIVYAITNPFVPINALAHPHRLHSNVANTTAMYPASAGGLLRAIHLIAIGTSPLLAIAGVCAAAYLFAAALRRRDSSRESPSIRVSPKLLVLLAAPAVATLIPFILFATHKPPEYARFALIIDLALLASAFAAIARFRCPIRRSTIALVLLIATAYFGIPYLAGFMRDERPITSRLAAAAQIQTALRANADAAILLSSEPAPYDCPPINLFRTRLTLLPPGAPQKAGLSVTVDSDDSRTPISWADARFSISSSP